MTVNTATNGVKNPHTFKVMNDGFYSLDHYMILTAVFYGDKHHGYVIHKHINNDLGYDLTQPTMYRKISDMVQGGYLSIPRVNKNRKIYKITDYGVQYLEAIREDIHKLLIMGMISYNHSIEDDDLGVGISSH